MNRMDYQITYIAIEKLSVVWRQSQRRFDEKWAKKLASEFDPDKFEPVIVTQPNGEGFYHTVEGQHRTEAAAIFLGDKKQKIPCHVIGEADPARAAEVFLGINQGRKKIRPVAEFLVAVEAKRELEVAVYNIVKNVGYSISEYSKGERVIMAVGSLKRVYSIYGAAILLNTLRMCNYIWDSDPYGIKAPMIQGFGMFFNEFHVGLDAASLKKALLKQYKTPFKFLEACKFAADKTSQTIDVAMSDLMRTTYNKGRPAEKRLKRKER